MEKGTPTVTVEADVYNSWLIASRILRSVEKEGVSVTVRVDRAKSVELDITVKILEQFETGAIEGAGALFVVGLWRYLKNRRKKVEEEKKRRPPKRGYLKPPKEEYIIIKKQTTEWREIVRRYGEDEE